MCCCLMLEFYVCCYEMFECYVCCCVMLEFYECYCGMLAEMGRSALQGAALLVRGPFLGAGAGAPLFFQKRSGSGSAAPFIQER